MPTDIRWVIARPDGQAFAGIRLGVLLFTADPSAWRCYLSPGTARALIKRHRMTACEPLQVSRPSSPQVF